MYAFAIYSLVHHCSLDICDLDFMRVTETERCICFHHALDFVGFFGFWVLVCYAATQLATQLQQRRIQVVRSNKVALKRLTESNSTPAMDLGHMNVVLKWCICMLVGLGIVDINIITILMFSVLVFVCWFFIPTHN